MTKKMNVYAKEVHGYDDIPKAVFAAIAVSFAMRLCEDDFDEARKLIVREWEILERNGIVTSPLPAYMLQYVKEIVGDE